MNTAQRTASRAKRKYQADPNAFWRVFDGLKPFTPADHARLNLPVFVAVDSISRGNGTDDDFLTVNEALNLCTVCAEKIDPMVEKVCDDAHEALVRMLDRHGKHGSWGFDGPGYTAVKEVVDLYGQLTTLLTPKQLQEALVETLRRIRAAEAAGGLQ